MPWYTKKTEYTCEDCNQRFYNRAAAAAAVIGGNACSPVSELGLDGRKTLCADCAPNRQRTFTDSTAALGTSFGVTISYRIHNHGRLSFLSGPVMMNQMINTAAALAASAALGRMEHPGYPGGMIRAPNAYSGQNEQGGAMGPWPADGMGRHHVHVGVGINGGRVLMGWRALPYLSDATKVQSMVLWIGS